MQRTEVLMPAVVCCLVLGSAVLSAEDPTPASRPAGAGAGDANAPDTAGAEPPAGEAPTPGFGGLRGRLAERGIEVGVGSTHVYQSNVRHGLGTRQQSGRLTGSYDLTLATDFEKLVGVPGLGLFVHGQGGWPATPGIDETMVGSVFGVNTDVTGRRPLDVVEAVVTWNLVDAAFTLRVGKMDLTGVFDASDYANDETAQFLNGALVNNPTIPFPDYCLGVVVTKDLTDQWHLAAGVGDAEANGRETGLNTTFGGEPYFFYIVETAFCPRLDSPRGKRPGNYRFGLWYDPQPKANADREEASSDDVGFYASADQMLLKENDDPQDRQGFGLFGRYGWADAKRNDLTAFWSVGCQYQGLWPGRNDDVLGIGWARGAFSQETAVTFPAGSESVLELYYSVRLAPWATIAPSVQYLTHPGGSHTVADALVVGARAQVIF